MRCNTVSTSGVVLAPAALHAVQRLPAPMPTDTAAMLRRVLQLRCDRFVRAVPFADFSCEHLEFAAGMPAHANAGWMRRSAFASIAECIVEIRLSHQQRVIDHDQSAVHVHATRCILQHAWRHQDRPAFPVGLLKTGRPTNASVSSITIIFR